MDESDRLYDAVLRGDANAAAALAREALASGCDPREMVSCRMIPAMDEVGRRFERGEFFVPELLLAGRAMKSALKIVQPLLGSGAVETGGVVVMGTVQGDLHDIGKNLVSALLEGGGFKVHDLGVDVPASRFVDAIKRYTPDIIGLSALLTVTLPAMKTTLEALRSVGVRDRVKVIVGGAPVTREYAVQIGADGYSDNAFGAVRLARTLIEGNCHAVPRTGHS